MEKQDDIMIPVDGVIDEFHVHLLSHPRTILSARFGDGKSYFIQQLMQNEEMNREFVFLKLYPVNYQVVDNKDIFELVKRDLLVQLMLNGMINSEYEVSDSVALAFYLQTHGVDIAEILLSIVNEVDSSPAVVSAVIAGIKSLKFIRSLREKINKFKKENSRDNLICDFLDSTDGKFVYENDAISKIISDCIIDYQEKTGKRVVLFFEDMDRIDPAHLFRILNVLSAQMDYCYKVGVSPDDYAGGNKFGAQNIVVVLDYENLNSIFAHFYGPDTRMEGYISKFTNKGYFKYSLIEERERYVAKMAYKETGFDSFIWNKLIPSEYLKSKTLRQICSALDETRKQIKHHHTVYFDYKTKVELHPGILSSIVAMRRLGMNDEEIVNNISYLIVKCPDIMEYIGGYISKMEGIHIEAVTIEDNNKYVNVYLGNLRMNGTYSVSTSSYGIYAPDIFDVTRFSRWLLNQVAE